MAATLRYRGDRSNLIEMAKNLDAFKKVPEKYTEPSEIGGTLSLLSRILIIYLIYKEICYYQNANLVYQFEPDIDMDDKVLMNVDITVAMPCTSLSGVDLMDETQQDVFSYGTLQREGTWWAMTTEQRMDFERIQHINSFLREEYHSVADILFKDIIKSNEAHDTPTMNEKPLPEEQYDACRLHGTLGINKVAGVLHLIGGAQPVFGLLEDHFVIELRRLPANFTHRINRLSFGTYSRRIVQPLEGDETFVGDDATTVQYFLKIVPTEIHNTFSTINTYQYSVTENVRKLDAAQNTFGSPGIYFKYDWSALKIIVRTDRDNIIQFVIRLCSIIAGIIVISGVLNSILLALQRKFIKTLAPQALQQSTLKIPLISQSNSIPRPTIAATSITNDLINVANSMTQEALESHIVTGFVPTIPTNKN
ncbi:endoplasmic reticulum-Golgi intermediate compartment protein 2 [Teleopsis dalmanni]|uniref:endoplasmic reticulum-Golgi intermediate compartment protein 2-like n=1 Tax=Teleopsis dalmanni TaxID=139649 RepID=UPI0018CD9B1A|nr:endoplasmic reticulum-Golgi intermediate compartment protein 2-like [Teleopsis dalmanni]XP_037935340.1 endoplasmic reticulum-Golgi intermediate compartment protein 2 [Teleopsis dalmanni]